ncbi:hypothetical protein LAWI1_G008143 [Lachnellula willkommii]|uniref:DUF6604 domain-containing protein n=1 Tax=Lachnellula willkommii TaxID=215461 RepID=A0A559M736_9HELO|nr:hypothetical protein LAWI1_G008143 [Lachnellula willkommii]
MLPSSLTGTYERYKDDTSTFLRWLLENAPKCSAPAATPASAPSKNGRLKGKARLDAKKPVPAPPTNSSQSQEHCIVSLKELMPLATSIVNCDKPFITVPVHVCRAGLRAVSARKRCTSHFMRITRDKETAESNQRHSYFSSLMEDVLRVLQPRFLTTRQRQTNHAEPISAEKIDSFETIANRFAALEVEDTEELDNSFTASPESVARVYELETPRDKKVLEEERMFSIFCLLEDFWQLRDYVSTLWSDYKDEKIDLITASATTNAAFMLAIRSEHEALAAYPELRDTQDVLTALKSYTPCDESTSATSPRDGVNLEDWAFGAEYDILSSFCHVSTPDEISRKRGYDFLPFLIIDRSKLSHEDQQLQDLSLLHNLLPEFGILGSLKDKMLYTQDELTRGMCLMIAKGSIPIWLPMATRCYLDIRLLLQQSVNAAFIQLLEVHDHAETTVNRYLEFSKGLKPKESYEYLTDNISKIAEGLKYHIIGDWTFGTKRSLNEDLGFPPPPEGERNYLYNRQPILCGLIAYRIVEETRRYGLELNIGWGSIAYPAQLYNALRKKANPISVWPLMEEAISIHGDRLFVGRRPTTISDCFKNIELISGGSPSNLAKNRRNIRKPWNKRARSKFLDIDTLTLGPIFRESWKLDTRNDVVRITAFQDGKTITDPERFTQLSIYEVEKLLNSQAKEAELAANPKRKSLGRKWQNTKCFTSLQLLQALRESMLAEMPKLHFNYYLMYEQSINLMRALVDELDADFVKILGLGYLTHDNGLSTIAYVIIGTAFHCTQAVSVTDSAISRGGRSKMLKRSLPVGASLFEKTGRVVEKFLKEQAQNA